MKLKRKLNSLHYDLNKSPGSKSNDNKVANQKQNLSNMQPVSSKSVEKKPFSFLDKMSNSNKRRLSAPGNDYDLHVTMYYLANNNSFDDLTYQPNYNIKGKYLY